MQKLIYISGASGQIGKALREEISLQNIKTIVLGREEIEMYPNETFIKYNLGESIEPLSGEYIYIFIHLAYCFKDKKNNHENINVIALKKIKECFDSKSHKRIIYLSTPDVNNKKSTTYTNVKKISEQVCDLKNDLVIRPSWIHSNKGINSIFSRFPNFYIPIPKNKNCIAPILLERFVEELLGFSLNLNKVGIFLFVGKDSLSFKKYLKKFHNINAFFLPKILWRLIIFILKKVNHDVSFYIIERIEGFINIRDISSIRKEDIDEVII